MKIRSKIAVMALTLVLITTAFILAVLYTQLENMRLDVEGELFKIEINDAKKIVHDTSLMVSALRTEVEKRLRYDLKTAFALLDSVGPLQVTNEQQMWSTVNQLDFTIKQVTLPKLTLPGVQRNEKDASSSTDIFIRRLSKLTGVTCTLFQRINDAGDMLRASTTVPTITGESAFGTYIPAIHPDGSADPVISKVMSGAVFVGRAYVVNAWYNTAYMPLYASDKHDVIGMLYVGERQSKLVGLLSAIEKLSVANGGHIFMLQPDHEESDYRMMSVSGEVPPSSMCRLQQQFINKLSENRQQLHPGVVNVVSGVQLAPDLPDMKNMTIAYTCFTPWDWVIGMCYEHKKDSPSYIHLTSLQRKTFAYVVAGAFLCFFLALLVAYRLAAGISRPLERAVKAFEDVGRGCFEGELERPQGFELQQLYASFNGMLQDLRRVTISHDKLDEEVVARKNVEKELQQAANNLQLLIDAAPVAITVISADKKIKLWNPAAELIFGWSENEIKGKPCMICGEDLQDDFEATTDIVLNGIIIQAKEVQRYHKDGHKLNLLLSAAPIYGDVGASSMIAIYEDISDLKEVQRQLEQRHEQYKLLSAEFKAILDGIQDAISVIGPDLRIRWSNHCLLRWGVQDGDIAEHHCYWNKDRELCADCPVVACFASGEIQSAKVISTNGIRWGVKVFPQVDDEGNVVSVIEVASDISESIALREEAIRSARLASLGELAAGVAHEINNPNGVIMHNAPIMQDVINSLIPMLDEYVECNGDFTLGRMRYSKLRDKLRQLPTMIMDSSQRIKLIVEDLKNFVRDDSTVEKNHVSLNYVLEAAVRLTANTVKNATHNFHVSYAADLPRIIGSQQRIEQVIVNLIVNACQALPDVSAAIDIYTRYDKDNRRVELVVADQGCGINDTDITKVTNPFFTTKRESGGTGLGLSISTRIIEEHGGRIYINSILKRGTTITVSLPVAENGDVA